MILLKLIAREKVGNKCNMEIKREYEVNDPYDMLISLLADAERFS